MPSAEPTPGPRRGPTIGTLGLTLALALIGFAALAHGGVQPWARATLELVIAAMLLAWIVAHALARRLTIYRSPLDLPLLGFFAVALASTLGSAVPWVARAGLIELTLLAGFGFLVRHTLRRSRDVLRFATGLVVLGAAFASLGLLAYGPEVLGVTTSSARHGRMAFTFANPNHFAGFLGMLGVLALAVACSAASRAQRVLFLLAAIYIDVAIVASGSRGGVVAVVAGSLVLAGLHVSAGRARAVVPCLTLLVPLVMVLAVSTAPRKALGRLGTIATPFTALASRFEIWRDAVHLVRERPLLGFGPGAFVHVFPAWQSPTRAEYEVNAAHNDYLEVAVDFGILGLAAALVVLGFAVLAPIGALRRGTRAPLQSVGFGAVAGVLTLAVHASVEFHSHVPATLLLVVLLAALAERAAELVAGGDQPSPTWARMALDARGAVGLAVGALVVVALGVAAARSLVVARERDRARRAEASLPGVRAALSALERAHRWAPRDGDIATDLARKLGDRAMLAGADGDPARDRARALQLVDAVIGSAPRIARSHHVRAGILQALGRTEEALTAAKRAVELAPGDAGVRLDLARYELAASDVAGAAASLRAAMVRDRDVLPAAIHLLQQSGVGSSRLRDFVPAAAWAHEALAVYLESRGEVAAALDARDWVLALEPTAAHASDLVGALRVAGRHGEAIAAARLQLGRFPGEPPLLWQAVAAYRAGGREEQALDLYRQLVRLEPSSPRALLGAGAALRRAGLCDEARPLLERAATLDVEDARPYLELAACHRAGGRGADVVLALDRAIARSPNDANLHYRLALELLDAGLAVRAKAELEACLAIDPDHAGCVAASAAK